MYYLNVLYNKLSTNCWGFFQTMVQRCCRKKIWQLYHPRYALKWGFYCLALWRKILIIRYVNLHIPSPQKDLLKMRGTNRRISKEKWSLGIYSHLNIWDGSSYVCLYNMRASFFGRKEQLTFLWFISFYSLIHVAKENNLPAPVFIMWFWFSE